jgi:hypothetical protein
MRDYLDGILAFIGQESLTDEEFESITLENTDDKIAVYESLLGVLESRGASDVSIARLQHYFLASGVPVVSAPSATSNIFMGSPLE